MNDIQLSVTLYAEPGPQNTDKTLSIVKNHALANSIQHVVVASDTGKTAHQALKILEGLNVVVVTNPANLYFPVANLHDYLPRFQQHKQTLLDQGVKRIACSLPEDQVTSLRNAGADVTRIDWKRVQAFTQIRLGAIDRVGVGIRVGLTISAWACLSKLVPPEAEVVAVSGTGFGGGGADTAIVVRTAPKFTEFRVMETLAKPRVGPPSKLG